METSWCSTRTSATRVAAPTSRSNADIEPLKPLARSGVWASDGARLGTGMFAVHQTIFCPEGSRIPAGSRCNESQLHHKRCSGVDVLGPCRLSV